MEDGIKLIGREITIYYNNPKISIILKEEIFKHIEIIKRKYCQ